MRHLAVLFLCLLAIGCGSPSGDPRLVGGGTPGMMAPSITSLSPDSVPVNSVAFALTVNGTNFNNAAVVVWNGAQLNTTVLSSTELMATLSDTNLMFAGQIPVYVRSGNLNSNTVTFNVAPQ